MLCKHRRFIGINSECELYDSPEWRLQHPHHVPNGHCILIIEEQCKCDYYETKGEN